MRHGPIERELKSARHSGRVDKQLLADGLGMHEVVAVLQERGMHVVHHAWRGICQINEISVKIFESCAFPKLQEVPARCHC